MITTNNDNIIISKKLRNLYNILDVPAEVNLSLPILCKYK